MKKKYRQLGPTGRPQPMPEFQSLGRLPRCSPGAVIVDCDFAGIEARVAAMMTECIEQGHHEYSQINESGQVVCRKCGQLNFEEKP